MHTHIYMNIHINAHINAYPTHNIHICRFIHTDVTTYKMHTFIYKWIFPTVYIFMYTSTHIPLYRCIIPTQTSPRKCTLLHMQHRYKCIHRQCKCVPVGVHTHTYQQLNSLTLHSRVGGVFSNFAKKMCPPHSLVSLLKKTF